MYMNKNSNLKNKQCENLANNIFSNLEKMSVKSYEIREKLRNYMKMKEIKGLALIDMILKDMANYMKFSHWIKFEEILLNYMSSIWKKYLEMNKEFRMSIINSIRNSNDNTNHNVVMDIELFKNLKKIMFMVKYQGWHQVMRSVIVQSCQIELEKYINENNECEDVGDKEKKWLPLIEIGKAYNNLIISPFIKKISRRQYNDIIHKDIEPHIYEKVNLIQNLMHKI